ncbi:unnamed protein product, partial [Rotaria sp. Silwood2]
MFSSIQNSSPTCKIIEIPPGLIENGKTLLIETHYELFINDYHLSRPLHFITQNHGLCLVDTQQKDFTSDEYYYQLNSHNYDYVSSPTCKIIEIPSGLIENGKTLLIETHYELYINDYHLSRPSHFITQNHGLCLVDTQQKDFTSDAYYYQLNAHNYDY